MTDIFRIGMEVDSRSVDSGRKSLSRFGKQAGKTGRATDGLNQSFRRASVAAGVLAVAAAGLAASFVVDKIKTFEKSISDLSAITGATGKDLEFLRRKSLEFGASTTLSASESAEAFKLIASAKPDLLENAAALAKVTRETITLSEAAGIELPAAASSLGNALNQFNAGADQASRFVNVLAAGSKFGASSIEEIAAAMVNAGGTAATVGLSFEQTNAVLQVMAASGIKAAEAGTGLRSVLLRLEAQSNDRFRPSMVGVAKAFQNIKKENLSTIDQMELFGKLMFNQGNTLVKNADKISILTGKLTGTATAHEQASIRVNNLDGNMKRLNSTIEAQALSIGGVFSVSIRTAVQAFTELIASEKATEKVARQAIKDAQDLGMAFAFVADVAGNAVNGILLPFQGVSLALSAVAKQVFLIMTGEFSAAMKAGADAVDTFKATVDHITDPAVANRFQRLAKGIIDAQNAAKKDESSAGALKTVNATVETKKLAVATKTLITTQQQLQKSNATLIEQDAAQIFRDTRTPLENYNTALAKLNLLLNKGAINQDTFNRAVKKEDAMLKAASESTREASAAAQELGLTFSSAFEDAVIGGENLKGVLRSLGDDIMKMTLRKAVTEPLSNAVSGAFSSAFAGSGGGGGSSGGIASFFGFADGGRPPVGVPSIVGERGPELFVPDRPGTVIPNGSSFGSDVTIVQNIDARGASADAGPIIAAAARVATEQAVNAIRDNTLRGLPA